MKTMREASRPAHRLYSEMVSLQIGKLYLYVNYICPKCKEFHPGNKIKAEYHHCAKGFLRLLTVILIRTPWVIRRRVFLNEVTHDLRFEQSVREE